jgi:small subunit ribosomal protein S8
MMTDPIADLLTRIRNANRARKDTADVPWSKLKEAIARVLADEGFLREVSVND